MTLSDLCRFLTRVVLTIAVGQVTLTSQAETNTTLDVFVDGEVGAAWDRGILAFDQAIGFGQCTDPADCPSLNWETVDESDRGTVLQVTHANNGNLAALFFLSSRHGYGLFFSPHFVRRLGPARAGAVR